MSKAVLPPVFFVSLFILLSGVAYCQVPADKTDTFFLVKKKGLLGKLGKSISTSADESDPVIKANPFLLYSGKAIRNIKIVRLGFERDINDTSKYHNDFGAIVANAFHTKTKAAVIANNLFFETGDRINPFLLADNERHLREQLFIQDALISIEKISGCSDSVDMLVVVKDVFSIGGGADITSAKKMQFELKDENLQGSGSKLAFSLLYDSDRKPNFGFGAEFLKRNVKGTFINWTAGFKSFKGAFNSSRNEETIFYTGFEKPLVSPYIPWVGAINVSFNKTKNNYLADSVYQRDFRYSYQNMDGWFGYNFGSQRLLRKNLPSRFRKFIAIRAFYQHFTSLPDTAVKKFDIRYSNVTGVLASASIFKQNFFRTNFIYGFGRNEDVQEGFNLSLISGWINKSDTVSTNIRSRPYFGLEGIRSHLNTKGFFSTYTLRIGAYLYKKKWEDLDILLYVDHFTRKKKINDSWFFRQFYSAGFTRQILATLNQPLYLNSVFGLPYFNNGTIQADLRCTAKTEAVFYNLTKFWGFRFAPFIFGDMCLVKPAREKFSQSELYSAVGAGLRTRNENLVFGTIELKAFYFPRTIQDMGNWRVEVNSNIRFKYSDIFSRKPDFIVPN